MEFRGGENREGEQLQEEKKQRKTRKIWPLLSEAAGQD